MIRTWIFFLLAVPLLTYSAETLIQPGTQGSPSQSDRMYLVTAGSKVVPARVAYSSDGNGNLVTLATQAQMTTLLGYLSPYSYSYFTGNASTTVKSGAGTLGSICVNNNDVGGTVTVYDNTSASSPVIAVIQEGSDAVNTSGPICLNYNVSFSTGLTVVTAGLASNDVTVTYK